jgi:LPXTG-motif cell wall-anchored protein
MITLFNKRIISLLLAVMMIMGLAAPALSFTIAVVVAESQFADGELNLTVDGSYAVAIRYGKDAGIPEDARIVASEVSDVDAYEAAAEGQLKAGQIAVLSRFFDIDIVDESGESVALLAPVEVQLELSDVPAESTGVSVFHFKDGAADMEAPLLSGVFALDGAKLNANQADTVKDDAVLPAEENMNLPAEDASPVEKSVFGAMEAQIEEVRVTGRAGSAVSFLADGFSVYGIVYTVDFHYDNGTNSFDFSIHGGGTVTLSELAEGLGIVNADDMDSFLNSVETLTFSDENLVKAIKMEEDMSADSVLKSVFDVSEEEGTTELSINTGDWLLISLAPFKTAETLTIVMKNGETVIVSVTDDQTTNLADFVTDATLEIDGKTYGAGETWKVHEGADYTLKLTFKEKGSLQFPQGGGEMVMEPEDLGGMSLIPGQGGIFDIPMGLYGTVTGNEWWVDSDGKLHIKFGEDPDKLLTRSNNAYIKLAFDVKFSGEEGQIIFNDTVLRDWEADTETDVSVTKSGHYNPSTGRMEYTITVTSTGNTSNIKITDTLGTTKLLTLNQDSITIKPEKQLAEEGNSTSSGGFVRIIKEMSHGETVTITYTADVNESALGPNGKVTGDDGKNRVIVENDQEDEDEKTHIVHEIKYSDLDKVSTSQTETEDGKILLNWQITANTEREASLVGSTITDRIDWDSTSIMQYVKNEAGNVVLTVTGSDSANPPNTYTQYIEVSPETVNGQESWTWTVANLGENSPGTPLAESTPLSYTISYKTIAEKSTNNVTVKNNAENSSGGSDSGVGVVPGNGDTPPSIITDKEATGVTAEYIDWDIVINVPEEGFPAGLKVTDWIPRANGGEDQENNGFADRLVGSPTVVGLTGTETFTWEVKNDYTNHYTRNGEPYPTLELTIDFYKDAACTERGLGSGPRTITIHLRTQNDPKWIEYALTQGTGDPIYKHINNGKVNDVDISAYAIPLIPSVKKEHRNTSEKDGLPVYEYMITLADVTELPVVIADTFNSDFLEFYRVGVDGWDPFNYIAAAEQEYQLNNGISPYAVTVDDTTPGTITITANDLPKKENGSFYEYYRIYYSLKVKDESALAALKSQALMNGGTYTLKNTAVWNDLPGECRVDYTVNVVKKEGYFATNSRQERKFTFVIDVNPERYNLSIGDTVELTDQHTGNLSVDYSSVKIYQIPEGTSIPDAKYAAQHNQLHSEWLCEPGSIPWNFTGNSGVFTLADHTHYIIVYDTIVIGTGHQEFQNSADLEGFTSYKKDERIYSSETSSGGDVWEIKLLKYQDGLTSHGLQGATFQLFKGTGEYYQETDGTFTEVKEPMKYGDTPKTRERGVVGKDITFTTGSNGLVTIKVNEDDDGNEIEGGVHYYLKEIESPAGYQIDSSTEYWSFTLTKDPDEVNYGDDTRRDEYGNLQWIYFYYNDILKMANTETTEPLNVVVNKLWFNEEGEPIDDADLTATVQLMRKTDNGEYVPVVVGPDNTITAAEPLEQSYVELTKTNNWSYRWNDLPRVEFSGNEIVHRFAYKIEEVELSGYVVSVSVSETETVKTYALNNYKIPDNKATNVTVNKVWQNAEGQTIEGTADRLPPEIRFRLYRAVSTTPFTRVPTTGGNLYVLSGDTHLVDAAASEGDADYGLYKVTKEENWTATLGGLPEVKTIDGQTYYYSYYVEEIPLTGYTASYSFNGIVRTIVNREPPDGNNEYTNIELEKKWTDGTVTTPPQDASAVFVIRQQKASLNIVEGDITVNLVDTNGDLIATLMASDGNQLSISGYHFRSWQQNNRINAAIYYEKEYNPGERDWQYYGQLVEDGSGNVTEVLITIDEGQMAINKVITLKIDATKDEFSSLPVLSNKSGGGSSSYSDYVDTGVTRTIVLPTADGLWTTVIKKLLKKDLEGNLYRYYITEDSCSPAAVSVVYIDQNGHELTIEDPLPDSIHKVEVTNTYRTTDFIFTKIWRDSTGTQYIPWPSEKEVTVSIKQNNTEYATYQINSSDLTPNHEIYAINDEEGTQFRHLIVSAAQAEGYVFVITQLPYGNGGEAYTYTVSEENTVAGFQPPKYEDQPNGVFHVGNGGTIYNDQIGVELPATGSSGAASLYLLGGSLTILAGAGYVLNSRRKKEQI